MKNRMKIFTMWSICIICLILVGYLSDYLNTTRNNIPFSEILTSLKQGHIQKIVIKNERVFLGSYKNGLQFYSYGVITDTTLNYLNYAQQNYHTQFSLKFTERSIFSNILFSIFPFLFVFGLIYFFMKQLQVNGNGGAMSFGKSKAKLLVKKKKITFADVAGMEECKNELEEIVEFLKSPAKFTKLGGKIPKGILLIGEPGTGKTLLAQAVAGEAQVPFFSISGSDFVEMFVGVGASRVRDLFEQGKKNNPCIIFIDEIDAVGRKRGSGMGGGHDEREQTLNQLLVEMDGFEENKGIIIIAATNRIDVLDPAILRPGRFDRKINIHLPNLWDRKSIFFIHTKKIPLSEDVHIDTLAKITPGMSGADIANLVNEATLIAAKKNRKCIEMKDLENAQEKIFLGPIRKTVTMNYKEFYQTAYHESGHAIVATLLPSSEDPVHKISIIPRGQTLGVTMQIPKRDKSSVSKKFLEDQICILMSGRIAEELIFNESSSGASNDFERATSIATNMICSLGMSKELGPVTYKNKDNNFFIEKNSSGNIGFSEKTAYLIDKEIKNIICTQYDRAKYILSSNITILHNVANTLIEYETISGKELRQIIKGKIINRKSLHKQIKIKSL